MSDWIDNSPEAQAHLATAAAILDQQGTINALREKEGALAHALLDMRAESDRFDPSRVHTVNIPVDTAALALATLMRLCDQANPADPGGWILDRVAAADLSAVLVDRDRADVTVWLDSRSADQAHVALCRAIDHHLAADIEVIKLAATDLATALNTLGENAP